MKMTNSPDYLLKIESISLFFIIFKKTGAKTDGFYHFDNFLKSNTLSLVTNQYQYFVQN